MYVQCNLKKNKGRERESERERYKERKRTKLKWLKTSANPITFVWISTMYGLWSNVALNGTRIGIYEDKICMLTTKKKQNAYVKHVKKKTISKIVHSASHTYTVEKEGHTKRISISIHHSFLFNLKTLISSVKS